MEQQHELYIEKLLIYQSSSSILQFFADITIEILVLVGVLPYVKFRMAYTFLAFITGFTSFKTLDSIRKNDFGLVHEDIQVTFICELSLIATDFWFVFGLNHLNFIFIRLPFIVLTFINLFIISFIMIKYRLFSLFYQGPITDGPSEPDLKPEENVQS